MPSGGHLGYMQISEVAQSCHSGNQAKLVLKHLLSAKKQKTSLYSTFLG